MKASIENGKAFLKSLGMEPAATAHDFAEQITNKVDDRSAAEQFASEWNTAIQAPGFETRCSDESYSIKNRDPQVSMVTSAVFNWNYLVRMCDYILAHRDLFGKTILDAGCGNGILTVFLALVFPDSQITAVDRNPDVIKSAKWLIKKLEIENIDLRQGDAADISGKKFDTVFSSRTVIDNGMDTVAMEWTDTTEDHCRNSENLVKAYADTLANFVAPNGCLVCSEVNGEWPIWGWMRVLCSHDLVPVEELCGLYADRELDGPTHYAEMVFKAGKSLTAAEGDRVFAARLVPAGLWDADVTDDRYGLIKLHMMKDQLFKGYAGFVTNPEYGMKNYRYFSFEMWTVKGDPKHMLFRQTIHYRDSIRVSLVDFEDALLAFNAALFDISNMAEDPHLTVYEVSFENGEEKLQKVRQPRSLYDPQRDLYIREHSALIRQAEKEACDMK